MSNFAAGYFPAPTDTKRIRWAKVLEYYQSLPDALPENDLHKADALRPVMVKVLKAINNHYGLS